MKGRQPQAIIAGPRDGCGKRVGPMPQQSHARRSQRVSGTLLRPGAERRKSTWETTSPTNEWVRTKRLPVGFPPMGHSKDENLECRILNLIDYTVVANTDSPSVTRTNQFDRYRRTRIGFEGKQRLSDALVNTRWETATVPISRWPEQDRVRHQAGRSPLSARAWRRGIACPSSAKASSARTLSMAS